MSPTEERQPPNSAIYTGSAAEKINAWMQLISDGSQGKVRPAMNIISDDTLLLTCFPLLKDWMNQLVPHLQVTDHNREGPHPSIDFRFVVRKEHCNNIGSLHGGCTATLFDICTTLPLAFITQPGYWHMLGISRTLTITYATAAHEGDVVLISCKIIQAGNKLATIQGVMKKALTGQVVATCEHGKYNVNSQIKEKI